MNARATAALMLLILAGGEVENTTVSGLEKEVKNTTVSRLDNDVKALNTTASRLEKEEKNTTVSRLDNDVEALNTTVSRLETEEKKAAAALRAIRDQLEQDRAHLAKLTEAGPDNATSVVAGASDHQENPSSRTLLVEHPLDPSKSTSLVEDADEEVMGHSTAWWTWAGVLGVEIVMGYVWFSHCAGYGTDVPPGIQGFITVVSTFVLSLYQWVPLVAIPAGWARCSTGLPWAMHVVYAGLLALGSPLLGHVARISDAPVPVLGLRDTSLAMAYWYGATLLNCYDTYGDALNVAVAYSCGWSHAWVSLAVLINGTVLQIAAAGMMTGGRGMSMTFMGANPESASFVSEEGVKFMVTMGIWRMLTENIPQGALAIWLAIDLGDASPLLYINVAVSMAVAAKGFARGVQRMVKGDFTALSKEGP